MIGKKCFFMYRIGGQDHMNYTLSKKEIQARVKETLSHEMSVEWQDATDE